MNREFKITWIAALMAGVFIYLSGPAAAQDGNIGLQMQRLRRDLSDLQSYVYAGKTPPKQADGGVTSSQGGEVQSVSRMQVQLQNIESQMRDLTGRAEEMEHRITTLQERLEKFMSDAEQRFRALEPGAAGGAATPGRQSSAGGASMAGIGAAAAATSRGSKAGQRTLGTLSSKDIGGAARSVKSGSGQPDQQLAALPDGTPKEQYDHAFGLLQKRKYAEASVALKAFVDKHPDDALTGNALYWLGETHYFQKDYAESARIFLEGYKRYPKGSKAPANLYKLGKSLAAINEKTPACAALRKLRKSYPKTNKQLLRKAKTTMSEIGCS